MAWHRNWLRHQRLQLLRTLGVRGGAFVIPYRHAAQVTPIAYPMLESLFAASEPSMRAWLDRMDALAGALQALDGPPPEPRWQQDWFPRLDGAALYTLVRCGQPRRVLEIGSGHSTRFTARAVADGGFACGITCIDPAPRAAIERLPITLHRRLLDEADLVLADGLAAGDILFIDSSHIAMPGTDVDLLLNGMLPRLRPGVLVHIHDILLPDPYPPAWSWRGYNEQSAVACLLQGGGYAIRFASRYVATRMGERLQRSVIAQLPLIAHAVEGSLWLEKLPPRQEDGAPR